jgi:protein prenyltransferase alpha subunit repeat containing protein 1
MQVYSYASKRFFDLDLDFDSPLQLDHTSSLVLLVNPAHRTALNRRKDLIISGYISNADDELRLTTVLQSLPDGAKSSILWHHRRWVLNHFRPRVSDAPPAPDSLSCISLPLQQFTTELEVASIACETYPRNYHAWLHKCKVVEALAASYKRSTNTESEALFRTIEDSGIKYVGMHIKDYSSMHYMCRVFDTTINCGLKEQSRLDETKERPYRPVEHAKELLVLYPTYESLWYYLRVAIRIEQNLGTKIHDDDIIPLSRLPQSKDPIVEKYREAFARWARAYAIN